MTYSKRKQTFCFLLFALYSLFLLPSAYETLFCRVSPNSFLPVRLDTAGFLLGKRLKFLICISLSFTNRKDENGQNNMPLGREKCFHDGLRVKNLPANAGDAVLIPGFGRSSGEGNVNVLQYSCLGNPMNRGAWWVTD